MGVYLTPIIVKRVLFLRFLGGKFLAVDANNYLYQFLSLIRTYDGNPLRDSYGRITSHLVGLAYRTTRLLYDYKIGLVFVFDGKPPQMKKKEIDRRRKMREKAVKEWREALDSGDYITAFSKAVMSSKLTKPMVDDAKKLLGLLGIPCVQAPSEAEAQSAYMAVRGDVWAASSKDYDSLLFGAPRLIRFLTITGKKFLPSKGVSRPLKPEIIELDTFLSHLGINREQLVDLAILIGTDFNEGIKGIGPKKALRLIREYRRLEEMPNEVRKLLPKNYDEIRKIFLKPEVTSNYEIRYEQLKEKEIFQFLCEERDFSRKKVEIIIKRMKKFYEERKQKSIKDWFSRQNEN